MFPRIKKISKFSTRIASANFKHSNERAVHGIVLQCCVNVRNEFAENSWKTMRVVKVTNHGSSCFILRGHSSFTTSGVVGKQEYQLWRSTLFHLASSHNVSEVNTVKLTYTQHGKGSTDASACGVMYLIFMKNERNYYNVIPVYQSHLFNR